MGANPKWGMSDAQREAWNKRALTVTVLTRCETCGMLKNDVQLREHTGYYPIAHHVKMTSCSGCFEAEKKSFHV